MMSEFNRLNAWGELYDQPRLHADNQLAGYVFDLEQNRWVEDNETYRKRLLAMFSIIGERSD